MHTLRLGTRGSKLALWQAHHVAAALEHARPDITVHITAIATRGDTLVDAPPSRIEGKAMFTSEIEKALADGSIDIAVHSLKDLPSGLDQGLCIGAVLARENPLDALLSHKGYTFSGLPPGAAIGTSSLRRAAQIRARRPDLRVVPLRGNVETRIQKMHKLDLAAIVLAYAGVKRLGLTDLITEVIGPEVILPAAGQGVIAVEIRDGDHTVSAITDAVNDAATRYAITAERAFLHALHGGCQVPAGCLASVHGSSLTLQGLVASPEGSSVLTARIAGRTDAAAELGRHLAERLLRDGADKILALIHR